MISCTFRLYRPETRIHRLVVPRFYSYQFFCWIDMALCYEQCQRFGKQTIYPIRAAVVRLHNFQTD